MASRSLDGNIEDHFGGRYACHPGHVFREKPVELRSDFKPTLPGCAAILEFMKLKA